MGLAATYALQGFLVFELFEQRLLRDLHVYFPNATSLGVTVVYLATLPLCGMIALVWLEAYESRRNRADAAKARRRLGPKRAELRAMRAELFSSIDEAQADYLHALDADASSEDAPLPEAPA